MSNVFEEAVTVRKCNNHVALINREEGTWICISESVYNNLCWYIENDRELDIKYDNLIHTLKNNSILKRDEKTRRLECVTVMLTNKCNLSCKHCCATQVMTKKEISFDVLENVIKFNPLQIAVTGGEPLLHNQIEDVLKFIRKRYTGKIELDTNGTLVSKYLNLIVKYVDKVSISIDGINNEDTARYRSDGVFQCVLNAVDVLKEYGIEVSMSMVTYDDYGIDEFIQLNAAHGTIPIIRDLYINNRVLKNIDCIVPKGKEYFISTEKEKSKQGENISRLSTCGALSYQLFIDSGGGIYPCGGVAEEDFKLGNIQDERTFEQLLNIPDTYYRQVIDRMLRQDKFRKCQDCNVREFCWSCISEVLSKSVINEVFETFCESNYRKWNKLVWAERKRD